MNVWTTILIKPQNDFDVIITLLSSLEKESVPQAIPEHLQPYIADLRYLLKNPEIYSQQEDHQLFVETFRARKRAKISELSAMQPQDRSQLIAQSRLGELNSHKRQFEFKRKQLPQKFLSLPCPDLLNQLTPEQTADLTPPHRVLLENSNICRLVGCGKLSLDKLLTAEEIDMHFIVNTAMQNLLISEIIDEATFYKLNYAQRVLLTTDTFVFELICTGSLKLDRALTLNFLEISAIETPIVGYCINNNLISLDQAFELEPQDVLRLSEHQNEIINREMTVTEIIAPLAHNFS